MSIAEKLITIAENEQKVYEAGQQAEYDRFWDNYQQNGNRTNYTYAFSKEGWNNETFKPKYPIKVIGDGSYMFDNAAFTDFDFVERGVNLDTSGADSLTYMCRAVKGITRLGTISCLGCKDLNRLFYQCFVETIEQFVVHENLTYTSTFAGATNLKNITISGVIGNDISFSSCSKLTHDSLMSIIGALKPFVTYEEVITDFPEAQIYCPIVDAGDKDNYYEWWEITSITEASYGVLVTLDGAYAYPIFSLTGVNAMTLDEVPEYFKKATHYQLHSMEKGFSVKSVEAVPTGETRTLTLGETNLAKLTEAEKKTATDKGWILA